MNVGSNKRKLQHENETIGGRHAGGDGGGCYRSILAVGIAGPCSNGHGFSVMIDADTVEAVWNQANGVVQLFVNDSLLMALPQAQAREMANALLAAARVPDLARAMAEPQSYTMQGEGRVGGSAQVESLGQVIRREAAMRIPRHHAIPGTDADSGYYDR
jgi:hypothetical protein